jgi:hypothetical protein
MSRREKLREKILSGKHDKNLSLNDLVKFVGDVGLNTRSGKGSHIVISHPNIYEILNLQPTKDGKAKPYQVRRVRDFVKRYNLCPPPTTA